MMYEDSSLLATRITRLVQALSTGVYERDRAFKLCLLAALTGESVFLLGPPGIGKSLIARRIMHAFEEGSAFEYLMNRFSTPEELFGPLSIQALKDEGRYVRLTEGYLPEASVVFLDEIWKAGPAILNTLLTVVNEKVYRNGNQTLQVPMRLLITASNELPDGDSSLEPLYDRMLLRVYADRVSQKQHFKVMVGDSSDMYSDPVPAGLKITEQEYREWKEGVKAVSLPDSCFEKIYQLKTLVEERQEEHPELDLYVSDRRWKKSVSLLKASAFFNGRMTVSPTDILILRNCLWRDLPTRELIQTVMGQYAKEVAFEQSDMRQQLLFLHAELDRLAHTRAEALMPRTVKTSSLRGERYELDLNEANLEPRAGVGEMAVLLPLLAQTPLHQDLDEPTAMVRVAATELQKLVAHGEGTVPGFINDHDTQSYAIKLALDANHHLVLKDVANREIPVAALGPWPVSRLTRQEWEEQLAALTLQTDQLEQQLMDQRAMFNRTMPHNFIDTDLTDMVTESLDDLTEQMHRLRQSMDSAERLWQTIQCSYDAQ
ncbi:ATPase RavA domain-containing protein [Ferrimonas marina]|uniref:MoxR-like ATPase n=1 Tax=Ferrimonas marina TaxID=299255 RepID=A0A1M5ZF08_9GAMM|nr:ATPase RavA domain-containing protein [Ferrimonas marina]SHI22818.1 MoxR-like ATPase [Ferrimonas marina]